MCAPRQVSGACMRLVSLPLWEALSPSRLKRELEDFPPLRRHWQRHLKAKQSPPPSVRVEEQQQHPS